MSDIELKPCPFCGEDEILTSYNNSVQCSDCYLEMNHPDGLDESIDAWNTRTEPVSEKVSNSTPLEQQLVELQKKYDALVRKAAALALLGE